MFDKKATWKSQGDVDICVHIAILQFYNEICIYPRVTILPSLLVIVFKFNNCDFNNCNIINHNASSTTVF